MQNYKIEVDLRKQDRRKSIPIIALVCFLLGMYSIALSINSFSGLKFSIAVILTAITIESLLLHYSYKLSIEVMYTIIGIIMLGVEYIIYKNWRGLLEQMASMIYGLQTGISDTRDLTLLISLIVVTLTLIIFALEYFLNTHLLFWLLTTMIIVMLPIVGSKISALAVVFLVLFQFGFLTLQAPSPNGKKELMPIQKKMKVSTYSTITIIGVITLAGLIGTPLTFNNSEKIYEYANKLETSLVSILSRGRGGKDSIIDGTISRGNMYPSGALRLNVVTSEIPTEPIYIRCFAGKDYSNGQWTEANDMKMLQEEGYGAIAYNFDSMYFITNQLINGNIPMTISIEPIRGVRNTKFTPYYSRYIDEIKNKGTFKFIKYEQNEMNLSSLDFEKLGIIDSTTYQRIEGYKYIEQIYKSLISKEYINTPNESLPRLTALVDENKYTTLDDISAFIIYTIHSSTEYTLTPGWSSMGMDIAEDFLFNRQRGYCTHYALTATLMYRLYGIPARYASGYCIEPDEYTIIQEDGEQDLYYFKVTDESAHAWVELFLDGYGWVPVDVTPNSEGLVAISYPGFNAEKFAEIQEKYNWESLSNSESSTTDDEEADEGITITLSDSIRVILIILNILVVAYIINLIYKKIKLNKATDRELFYNLIELLHMSGRMVKYDGSELDFSDELHSNFNDIDTGETNTVMGYLMNVAFGQEDNTKSKIKEYYIKTANIIYKNLKFKDKLKVKLIAHYV